MMWTTLVMALREIRRNSMRSLLTMLGVIIGVGAVVSLVTIGDGATASITQSISALGDNLIMVTPGAQRGMGGGAGAIGSALDEADAEAMKREIMGIEHVAPTAAKSLLVVYGNRNWRTTVTGMTPPFLPARGFTVDTGREFTVAEMSSGRPVALIGATIKKELFGSGDPIGATVRLGKFSVQVVGVLGEKGAGMGTDNDDVILVPLKAFQQRVMGSRDVSMIYATVYEGRSTSSVKGQLELLMRERRRIGPGDLDDFNVRDMQEIIDTVGGTTTLLTGLLGAIAAVSLLVGGIGIMNIMLVSVTERTREIGIRLAIGALGRNVMLQFLIEAVVLSVIGGFLGVIVGLAGAYGVSLAMDIPYLISVNTVLLAFGFSAAVGVLFGYLPARKAAHFNPIDALRHE